MKNLSRFRSRAVASAAAHACPGGAVRRPARRAIAAGALLALLALPVQAGTITLRSDVLSSTPFTVGLNMGHFYPNTNAADYWDYIGASGTRLFLSADDIEPTDANGRCDDNGVWGDGVADLAGFLARRDLIDAGSNAESEDFIKWSVITPRYSDTQTGANKLKPKDVFGSMLQMGSSVLVNISASPKRFPITGDADWAGKWELWQHYYFQAYHLAKNFGVYRFSMYNEPNHAAADGLLPSEWQMRLELASDAIHRAVERVNRLPVGDKIYLQTAPLYPATLPVIVFAPNTATADGDLWVPAPPGSQLGDPNVRQKTTSDGQLVWVKDANGNPTTTPVLEIKRNAWTDWGALAVANRNRTFPGATWKTFDYYNYQDYGHTGSEQGATLNHLRDLITAAMPNETAFKIAITEVNASTASAFDDTKASMDTPTRYAQLGSILTNLGKNFIREVYVFKMAQTKNPVVADPANPTNYPVVKNGLAYTDNDSSSPSKFRYGGLSLGGEVARLYFKASQPARDRMGFNRTSDLTNLDIQVTRDATAKRVWVYLVNFDQAVVDNQPNPNATKTITLDTTALGIPNDNRVIIESVSPGYAGGVCKYTRVYNNQIVCGDLPPESVWLVTIPTATQQVTANATPTLSVAASADATVRDGTNKTGNFGAETTLLVKNDPVSQNGRNAAYLKFDISSSVKIPDIELAVLTLNGSTISQPGVAQAFVYGCTVTGWTETGLTWENSPGLAQNRATGNRIRNAVATGQGTALRVLGESNTLRLVGQITVDGPLSQERQIDVTDFVKAQGSNVVSFLLVQDPRRDITIRPEGPVGAYDEGDTQVDGLKFVSKEGATASVAGPTLKIVRRKATQ